MEQMLLGGGGVVGGWCNEIGGLHGYAVLNGSGEVVVEGGAPLGGRSAWPARGG